MMTEKKKRVFIIHGRDLDAKKTVVNALQLMALEPLDLEEIRYTFCDTQPSIHELIEQAFDHCMASVAIFSPDDEARLSVHFHSQESESSSERDYQLQPRQNVLYEAGYAVGYNRKQTIRLFVGELRRMSDLDGIYSLNISKDGRWALHLAKLLGKCGCEIQCDAEVLCEIEPYLPPSHFLEIGTSISKFAKPPNNVDLAPDPVHRRSRLLSVLKENGGISSENWRHEPSAPDYQVMIEARKHAIQNPLQDGDKVLVQMQSESVYNGYVGVITREDQNDVLYWVKFPPETGLDKKRFHVMYLNLVKE